MKNTLGFPSQDYDIVEVITCWGDGKFRNSVRREYASGNKKRDELTKALGKLSQVTR